MDPSLGFLPTPPPGPPVSPSLGYQFSPASCESHIQGMIYIIYIIQTALKGINYILG